MFADAFEVAAQFTRPLAISRRAYDDSCSTALGTFVVLNDEGWALTAAHILNYCRQLKESKARYSKYEERLKEIRKLPRKKRRQEMKKFGPKEELTKNWSMWWAQDFATVRIVKVLQKADLAAVQLDPAPKVTEYPTIKNPAESMRPGTSLCRLGYALHKISPAFDSDKGGFVFPSGSVPPPLFPIEGILTRNIKVDDAGGGYPIAFLETSSPGLLGQSGGPLFDRDGTVWGIQSQCRHFELGFTPKTQDGKEEEHQFLNAGWAVHPQTIAGFLQEAGIEFSQSAN